MDRKPLNNILVKPAGPDCTMACGYCFYSGKESLFPGSGIRRMSDAVLDEMMRQLMGQPLNEISIGWQGGEPTLMGLPFFRRAMELEKRHGRGKTVGNGLQTNGILPDRQWARFFREYSFLIGLSIDGPEHVHDRYRRMRGGAASWASVCDTAKMLLDAGVNVNALTVVNDYSARFPDEIYDFHKDLGLTCMQFIPCVETDPGDASRAAPYSVSAQDYGKFLCRLFDRWRGDFIGGVPSTSIRFFESLLFSYAGFTAPECTLCGECGHYVVVEHNGDVYSCDFFVEPRWKLGNLMNDSLALMLNSPRQDEFGRMKSDLPVRCKQCRRLPLCRGGCTKDRLRDPRDGNLNHFCASFGMLFEHAGVEMQRIVSEWRTKQEALERTRNSPEGPAGRNAPCPCGSGRKYKKCCGAARP